MMFFSDTADSTEVAYTAQIYKSKPTHSSDIPTLTNFFSRRNRQKELLFTKVSPYVSEYARLDTYADVIYVSISGVGSFKARNRAFMPEILVYFALLVSVVGQFIDRFIGIWNAEFLRAAIGHRQEATNTPGNCILSHLWLRETSQLLERCLSMLHP